MPTIAKALDCLEIRRPLLKRSCRRVRLPSLIPPYLASKTEDLGGGQESDSAPSQNAYFILSLFKHVFGSQINPKSTSKLFKNHSLVYTRTYLIAVLVNLQFLRDVRSETLIFAFLECAEIHEFLS